MPWRGKGVAPAPDGDVELAEGLAALPNKVAGMHAQLPPLQEQQYVGLPRRPPGEEHWKSLAAFKEREAENAQMNSQTAMMFFSHCWRDTTTQEKKRRMMAHLSIPRREGGPGIAYWADFLHLQAEGPLPWRSEIEDGIIACSKVVCFMDEAWLRSYNCLQELAYAIHHGKPVAVVILDQGAWDLLTVPGGAAQVWENPPPGIPSLQQYQGDPITKDQPFSLDVLSGLFRHLSSINLCPCRPLEEDNEGGMRGVLQLMEKYVLADLPYYKQHAELKSLAIKWDENDKRAALLLSHEEAERWGDWLRGADMAGTKPSPTETQRQYVTASVGLARRRQRALLIGAGVLFVLIICGLVASVVFGIEARRQTVKALEALEEADLQTNVTRLAAQVAFVMINKKDQRPPQIKEAFSPIEARKNGTWIWPNISTIKFKDLGPDESVALLEALGPRRNRDGSIARPHVRHLDLPDCKLGDEGAAAVARVLAPQRSGDGSWGPPSALEHLVLDGTDIRAEGAVALGNALMPQQAEDGSWAPASLVNNLVLYGNDIGDEGALGLSRALVAQQGHDGSWAPPSALKSLNLQENNIGYEGAIGLANALAPRQGQDGSWAPASTLEKLDLNVNDIGDEGSIAFGKALAPRQGQDGNWAPSPDLKELELESNRIGDEGAAALASALAPQQGEDGSWAPEAALKDLYIAGNAIGDEGREALSNPTIRTAIHWTKKSGRRLKIKSEAGRA